MPSATYAGDFETTAIPPYSATGTGLSALNAPEPLPYAQPYEDRPVAVPAQVVSDDGDGLRSADRRGTQDLGLLLLRVGFGALLIAHGLQKVFGWWGGAGLGSPGCRAVREGRQRELPAPAQR